jgi:hypothetical protein
VIITDRYGPNLRKGAKTDFTVNMSPGAENPTSTSESSPSPFWVDSSESLRSHNKAYINCKYYMKESGVEL